MISCLSLYRVSGLSAAGIVISLSVLCIFQVLAEIKAMEENIAKLKEAIEEKIAPMMLAQTRLSIRSQRPNNELVRDPVQYGLVDEVGEIGGSVEGLRMRLAESESALKALNRNELTLNESIEVKRKTLEIDKDQCMPLRSQLDLKTKTDN